MKISIALSVCLFAVATVMSAKTRRPSITRGATTPSPTRPNPRATKPPSPSAADNQLALPTTRGNFAYNIDAEDVPRGPRIVAINGVPVRRVPSRNPDVQILELETDEVNVSPSVSLACVALPPTPNKSPKRTCSAGPSNRLVQNVIELSFSSSSSEDEGGPNPNSIYLARPELRCQFHKQFASSHFRKMPYFFSKEKDCGISEMEDIKLLSVTKKGSRDRSRSET